MKYVREAMLWAAIICLGFAQVCDHDRLTLWKEKVWKLNREIERLDNCNGYLYQRVDFGKTREEIQQGK
jgi:hypothetical protein